MLLLSWFSVSIYSVSIVLVYQKKDLEISLPLIKLVTLLSDTRRLSNTVLYYPVKVNAFYQMFWLRL